VSPGSCRIDLIHFLAGWHTRRHKPGFSLFGLVFHMLEVFSNLCLGFFCCRFVVVAFGFTSQVIGWQDRFLPHDAMHKCGLCRRAVSVCASVSVSVTFVNFVKTNKHIFKIFSPSGSQASLVFRYQTVWRYSDGNPPNGGVEYRWGRQKSLY